MKKVKHDDAPNGTQRSDQQPHERLTSVADNWVLELVRETPPQDGQALVPAVDKAVRIMALINQHEDGLTLAEISKETQTTKSHCHGILKTLCYHAWLVFDDASKRYRLHIGVMRDLSGGLRDEISLEHMRPVLHRLSEAVGSSCVLSKPLPDGSFLVVDKVSADQSIEISYPMGYRLPPDATAHMRANLAWRSAAEVDAWFSHQKLKRYTMHTITKPAEARAEIQATRERGYARSNSEYTDGLTAIAMPVFDKSGHVILLCDCVGTAPIMEEKELTVFKEMTLAVDELHRLIGSRVPSDFPRPHQPGHDDSA
ncbi:IclR family transcriptional regulator [Devosia honganensis]|uniref:IclR family transcriptional regulator n=1 Tax=Devosia honganensis TaxID=1610527 RepID=A0ABV7X0D7_9HYPH